MSPSSPCIMKTPFLFQEDSDYPERVQCDSASQAKRSLNESMFPTIVAVAFRSFTCRQNFSSLKLFALENNLVDKCGFFQDTEFPLAFRSCFSVDEEPGNSHREDLSLSSFDRNKDLAFMFEW